MSEFINPFTDWGFKRIFGKEASKELLIEFLNDLLVGERVITDLAFLNNEQLPETQDGKEVIFDIYCRTDTGEEIVVEMQNRAQKNFKERALYYQSRIITGQGVKGEEYGIKAVYGVFLMNFAIDEFAKLRTDVVLTDRETGELFSDKLRQIYLSFPYFTKSERECETNFERWIYVLKNMETLKRMPFKAQMAVLQKLEAIASVRNLTKEEQLQYDRTRKVYRDNLAVEAYAKEREQKFKEREQALKKAEAALKNTVRNLRQMGMDTEAIAKATGLTPEEVEKL